MSNEEDCINSCQHPCEQWNFDCQLIENFGVPWPTSYLASPTNQYVNPQYSYEATIQLTVTDFDYPVFEEEYLWTLQDFVGSFGGVLRLFLGLDATILLRAFFFIVSVFGGISAAIVQIRKKKIEMTTTLNTNMRTVFVVPK